LFRQAVYYNNQALIILYDPVSKENNLFRIISRDNEFLFDTGFEEKFPIVALYPYQPHILTVEFDGHQFFGSGSSIFKYTSGKLGQEPEIESWDLAENYRILELASGSQGLYALYKDTNYTIKNQEVEPYIIYDVLNKKIAQNNFDGKVPFNLHIEGETPEYSEVNEPQDLIDLFLLDIKNMPASGMMSAGINNLEGEVIWSQSYYLQGFVDLLSELPDSKTDLALESLKPEIKRRLDFEMALIDRLMLEGPGLNCRAFTTDRTPVLHVVQTGKMLLLLKRYQQLDYPIQLNQYDKFRQQVINLDGHIEVLTQADGNTPPLNQGRFYLKWPKGVPFWADGSGVPYNHQNCWAAGVLFNENSGDLNPITLQATKDISQQVLDYEGFRDFIPKNSLFNSKDPLYYQWYYWWGIAKDGWVKEQNISTNTPTWRGDGDNIARPVYRSFDAIAILVGGKHFNFISSDLLNYFVKAVEDDGLEMFIIPYLDLYNKKPEISRNLAIKYIRVDEQPDFRNSFWAYKSLYKQMITD
jgi:hypothetical protein